MKKILIFSFICFSQSLFSYDCNTYASRALHQMRLNLKLDCRFTGGRWDLNLDHHYNWCNTVAINVAREEDLQRYYWLKSCIYKCIHDCKYYASRAVKQNETAIELGCGFTGPRWSSNFNTHYNWCVTTTVEAINNEDIFRKNAISTCMMLPPALNLDSGLIENN